MSHRTVSHNFYILCGANLKFIYLLLVNMLTGIVLLGLFIRLCVTLHSYSGQNTPPMFGDFEAQRHWMEITYNLPTNDWYFNSSDNDLMYWGLDYPPLTAYHSWLCGYVASTINSSFVKLKVSRGNESDSLKFYMRSTVIIADLITFIPAIVLFYLNSKNISHKTKDSAVSSNEATKLSCLLALIYPGIILIDHGHFQYNCVSLGLFVYAVTAISQDKHVTASVMFCLALMYKQMELYHALPFFFYLSGVCFSIFNKQGFLQSLVKLISIGSAVVLTILLVCLPFINKLENALQLLIRLFPIARGVFEDKVANVWCVLNIAYKLKVLLSNEEMAKLCLLSTCLVVIPCLYDVFMNKSVMKFKYCLINSALSFYLFSYQVHEKTILLAAIPALLILPQEPLACTWFLCISVFSMLPLLLKDKLLIPYIALSTLFVLTFECCSFNEVSSRKGSESSNKRSVFAFLVHNIKYLYNLSLIVCVVLTISSHTIIPPKRYPDIWPLIVSVYSCVHFIGFLVYFNVKQWTNKGVKVKHE